MVSIVHPVSTFMSRTFERFTASYPLNAGDHLVLPSVGNSTTVPSQTKHSPVCSALFSVVGIMRRSYRSRAFWTGDPSKDGRRGFPTASKDPRRR